MVVLDEIAADARALRRAVNEALSFGPQCAKIKLMVGSNPKCERGPGCARNRLRRPQSRDKLCSIEMQPPATAQTGKYFQLNG